MSIYAKYDVFSKKIEHFGDKVGILVIFLKLCDPTNYISARHFDPAHPIWTSFGLNILVDPRNKPAEFFFIFLKIQNGCRQSKINFSSKSAQKSHFGLANGSRSSDLDKIWQENTTQP